MVVVVVEILTAAPSDVPEEWVDLAAAAVLDFRLVEAVSAAAAAAATVLTPAVKAALAVAAAAALAAQAALAP